MFIHFEFDHFRCHVLISSIGDYFFQEVVIIVLVRQQIIVCV